MARILLIDDDVGVQRALKGVLEFGGHGVEVAPDGREGLRKFRGSPFDLVVLDMLMPEKEGLETLRELRQESPGVRVIAISGGGRFGAQECLVLAAKLGATRTLEKPVRAEVLLAAVREVLAAAG